MVAVVYKLARSVVLTILTTVSVSNTMHAAGLTNFTGDSGVTCPLWHYKSGLCCSISSGVSGCLKDSIYMESGHCLTWNNATNQEQVSRCLLEYPCKFYSKYDTYEIPANILRPNLNRLTCGAYNRLGLQCSKCIDGYGPAAFSDGITCADCSKNKYLWILVFLFQLAMVTLMYVVVVFLGINGAASPLNIIITYSQLCVNAFTVGTGIRISLTCSVGRKTVTVLVALMGVWNLDFLRYVIPPACVSTAIKTIDVILFDYVVAVFPLFLTALLFMLIELYDRNYRLIVCLSFPIKKIASLRRGRWNPRETILNTCITFLLLSYSKLLFVSVSLILPVPSYDCNGDVIKNSTTLIFDPSIRFLSPEHIPYIILALLVIVIFVILPPLVLLLYPTRIFRCCLRFMRFKRWDILHMIMDVFQGWYKDGTNSSTDYRSLSTLYMLIRIAMSSIFAAIMFNRIHQKWVIMGLVHVALGTIFLALKPYKKNWMNHVDGLLLFCWERP